MGCIDYFFFVGPLLNTNRVSKFRQIYLHPPHLLLVVSFHYHNDRINFGARHSLCLDREQ